MEKFMKYAEGIVGGNSCNLQSCSAGRQAYLIYEYFPVVLLPITIRKTTAPWYRRQLLVLKPIIIVRADVIRFNAAST